MAEAAAAKGKENVEELRKQVAQLTREWETMQTAIPPAKAGEEIIRFIIAKKDFLVVENRVNDWSIEAHGGCCCS